MARSWGHEVFVALDQLANAVLAGFADETISARSFRLGKRAKDRDAWDQWRVSWVIVDALFIWQDWLMQLGTGYKPTQGHCERAYMSEVKRLQLPPSYRE